MRAEKAQPHKLKDHALPMLVALKTDHRGECNAGSEQHGDEANSGQGGTGFALPH
jgi:hypothetical protein